MPVTKDVGRQWPVYAEVTVGFADLGLTGVVNDAIEIPNNSVVVAGGVVVDEVWDSGTSDQLDVGDSVDPNRYTTSIIDLQALGYTALDITGFKYLVGDDVTLENNEVGAVPTQGILRLMVWYVTEDRQNETMPTRA